MNDRALPVLYDRDRPLFLHLPELLRAVTSHPGKKDTNRLSPVNPDHRTEKGGNRGAEAVFRGGPLQGDGPVDRHFHMRAVRRDISATGKEPFTIDRQAGHYPGRAAEPCHEAVHEAGRHVLNDEDRHRKLPGEAGQDGVQYLRAAGGCTDGHHSELCLRFGNPEPGKRGRRNRFGRPGPGQLAVTQLMSPFAGMSMTWSPDRPGNWIFHCHFALHLMPDSISAAPDDPHMRGMVGLILGIAVSDRRVVRAVAAPPARQLRLIAVMDGTEAHGEHARDDPPMHFVLEENGRQTVVGHDISPEIGLTRGERVAITVVNRLDEPTSVHWHGIELEDSYVDGVPGVSGAGKRLAPEIAPGDSFVATFTPPRSGTFMYHAHVDEVREQRAGLIGALIVRDPGAAPAPDEHVFFLKGSRRGDPNNAALEINGEATPDTVVVHAGRPARFRLLSLATVNPVPFVSLTERPDSSLAPVNDTLLVRWRSLAKDGADLPAEAQAPRPARQMVSIGETYDFEYTPPRAGNLRLEVRTNNGRLLARVPIRVE